MKRERPRVGVPPEAKDPRWHPDPYDKMNTGGGMAFGDRRT